MKYTTDGKCEVFAGGKVIARSYLGNKGYEVRVLQGMNRIDTCNKIVNDCPDFAEANNLKRDTYLKLI